jgi:hypothetical protein
MGRFVTHICYNWCQNLYGSDWSHCRPIYVTVCRRFSAKHTSISSDWKILHINISDSTTDSIRLTTPIIVITVLYPYVTLQTLFICNAVMQKCRRCYKILHTNFKTRKNNRLLWHEIADSFTWTPPNGFRYWIRQTLSEKQGITRNVFEQVFL